MATVYIERNTFVKSEWYSHIMSVCLYSLHIVCMCVICVNIGVIIRKLGIVKIKTTCNEKIVQTNLTTMLFKYLLDQFWRTFNICFDQICSFLFIILKLQLSALFFTELSLYIYGKCVDLLINIVVKIHITNLISSIYFVLLQKQYLTFFFIGY